MQQMEGLEGVGAVNLGDLNHLQEGICFAAQLGVEVWRQLEALL